MVDIEEHDTRTERGRAMARKALAPGELGETETYPQRRDELGAWRVADNRRQAERWRARIYYRDHDNVLRDVMRVAPKKVDAERAVKKAAAKGPTRVKSPKYADGAGNTWGGMGKRPVWIHEALAAGKSLEDFLIAKPEAAAFGKSKPAKTSAKPKAPPQTVAAAKKRPPKKAAAKRSARIKSTAG